MENPTNQPAEVELYDQAEAYEAVPSKQEQNKYIEYCSIKGNTEEEKIRLYNTLKRADGLLKDSVNQTLEITNCYFRTFYSRKDNKDKCVVILWDKNGKSYLTTSFVTLADLRSICKIYGAPHKWQKPVKIQPVMVKRDGAKGDMLTLNLVA